MLTERPIPGQSLRTPPKNAPYERPPETANPLEALNIHLDNLSEKGAMEDVINALELDVDLVRNKILDKKINLDINPFLKDIIINNYDTKGNEFQKYLINNNLSSNMWVVAQKK